ncbi:MAG TPA: hypothetical protein VMY69_06265 [Phycisphaerae bacterium]|nr:hypothetical protein [Phycisphaerae bacterium]
MTRKQAIVAIAIGGAAVLLMLILHHLLPVNADWHINRILHHAWQGAVALGVAGGILWVMWPRPKPPRRDEERRQARRRVIALAALMVAAVILVVFAEVRRETVTRTFLGGLAAENLRAIAGALDAYAADHNGARPASLQDLVPAYLQADRLDYPYRRGPARLGVAAASPVASSPAADAREPAAFALAKEPPPTDTRERRPTRIVAYLRPGNAWAPITVVLEQGGNVRITGEDIVKSFEKAD